MHWVVACRFEDLLRAITVSRTDICNAMVFALDNAESATEVGPPPYMSLMEGPRGARQVLEAFVHCRGQASPEPRGPM